MVHSNVKFFTVQKVVNEKELADNLKKGWIMVTQLKSGEIVVEMQFNISQVLERGMAQIRSETKILEQERNSKIESKIIKKANHFWIDEKKY